MSLRDTVIIEMWNSIKPGETVLFERTGEGDIGIGVYHTLSWAKSKGFRMIIIDIMDSFSTLASRMALMEVEPSAFSEVEVIKIGGIKKHGKVLAHIQEISEPAILSRKFREVYEPLITESKEEVVAVVIGLEKLFVASELSLRDIQVIINQLAGYVGNPKRLGIYLLKREVLSPEREFVIKLLEDIATTVIRTSKAGRMTEFHIVKSLNRELEGVCIRI